MFSNCVVTAAVMLNVSGTICLANISQKNYLGNVCLRSLLPSGIISPTPCGFVLYGCSHLRYTRCFVCDVYHLTKHIPD